MMGKVIIDADTTDNTAQFQPALDAAKPCQAGDGLRWRDADVARRGNGRKRILAVVTAGKRHLLATLLHSTQTERCLGLRHPRRHRPLRRIVEPLQLRPAAMLDDTP